MTTKWNCPWLQSQYYLQKRTDVCRGRCNLMRMLRAIDGIDAIDTIEGIDGIDAIDGIDVVRAEPPEQRL